MLRTALKPRWLGLFALLVVIVIACIQLGLWQLGVARDRGRAEAVTAAAGLPATAVENVLDPHSPFPATASARRVTATGRYAASGQYLVADRRLNGTTGYWVLTPLVMGGDRVLPVVRGFVANPAQAPRPPDGQLRVEGALAPGESPAQPRRTPLPAGQLGSVDLSILVNQWSGDLYNAFLFATGETSTTGPVTPAPGLARVPPPSVPTGLAWRNAAYALQWWIFGAFAVWMWFKMVRDDARGRPEQSADVPLRRQKETTP